MSHDVFHKLKEDHKKVKNLFSEIKKQNSAGRRKELFKQLRTELLAHAEAEEKIFYPMFEDEKSTREQTLESYVEHATVRALLEKMSEEDPATDEWMAMCRVVSELVEHHVEEEEEELFPKARKILNQKQAADLESLVEQEEQEFKKSANF